MSWKKVVVSTITGLLMTVASGVLVWFFTREPASKEGIVYSISQGGVFGIGPKRLSSYAVSIRNVGTIRADNVNIVIKSPDGSSISQAQVLYTRPIPETSSYSKLPSTLNIRTRRFLTSDRILVSVLYQGATARPEVMIRSDNGIGEPQNDQKNGLFGSLTPLKLFVLLLGFGLWGLSAFAVTRKFVGRVDYNFLKNDMNNSAFIMFHAGMFSLAEEILVRAVKSGNTGPIVLSNLAAVRSTRSYDDEAKALIETSYRWAQSSHSHSVVCFNNFICEYNSGNHAEAANLLKRALKDAKEIRRYCERSLVVKKIVEDTPSIKAVLDAPTA